jgi:hypothetical protein
MNIRSVLTTNLDMSTTRVCTERTPQCTMSFQMMLKLCQDIGRAVYIKREMRPHYENSTLSSNCSSTLLLCLRILPDLQRL